MRPPRKLLAAFGILAAITLAALPLVGAGEPGTGRSTVPTSDEVGAPRRVKVLFLGDDGHHKPLDRFRQVYEEMARRGVDLTYADDLRQVTPANLKRFDAVALYANIEKVTPEAERALLDYVAAGGGYAVVHCGSFCFQNSRPLTDLAGGRFKRHGTGVFKETHVKHDHPVLKGLKEVESWDESYVHEMHNEKDREVLSQRVDKDGKEANVAEPYTWTRAHGKGRVFYTAWGHDERTWGNADFQDLLERGVRWAAGDWALQPRPKLPTPGYGPGRAPNYVVSKQWGTTGPEITRIPKPLPPIDSAKHLVAPAGVEPRLFASEPNIFKPVTMAWDERGRLWVAETVDYPNELQEPGKGRDRISILEDTDDDGRADRFTVFADKLSIPTSLCFADGGVIVAQAPDMLFLRDTNGDDVADERRVMFTGWATNDTHAGPSNLRWGPDNWVYGIVGYAGFNGTVGGERARFTQGIWRMRPDGSKIEFLASLTNNAWGLGFSEEGHLFAGTANKDPSFYLHIPNRAYETVRGLTVKRLESIADSNRMFAATGAVRQMDHHGVYTAAAGHAAYTARTWPSGYWNRAAFVAEPTGHVVGQFRLLPRGSGFVARNEGNLLASSDEWTSPIAAEVGPDGQVWVIDWYNYIIQHNPIPKGWEKGKGNAYETDLRDKTHGRIYRLVYKYGRPSPIHKLSKDDVPGLLAALRSDNQLWRMHAQRLLIERGDKSIAPELVQLSLRPGTDPAGLNPPAMHALWTLHGLGLLDGSTPHATAAAVAGLSSDLPGVRKAAVDVLPRTEAGLAALLASKALDDVDPQVRKSALLAAAEMPQAGTAAVAVGPAVYAALARPDMANDPWLADAATIAAARHDAGFLRAALTAFKAPDGAVAHPRAEQPMAGSALGSNLVRNGSFEETGGGKPRHWRVRHYNGEAAQELSIAVARAGRNAVALKSEAGADTSWYIDVPVEANTRYKLSGWIRTENVKPVRNGRGALLNVHGTEFRTTAVTGTADWQQVETTFDSGARTRVSINCLFGGYGQATGTAYFDDVELTKVGGGGTVTVALPGATGRVLGAVITHYAKRSPKESVVPTLSALRTAQPQIATVVIDALSASWPEGAEAAPQLTEADAAELQTVMAALPPAGKDRLLALATKWGRADLFGEALASALKSLTARLDDAKAAPAARAEAAKRLIAVADTPETVSAVTRYVNAQSGPEVQRDLLSALAESRSPAVGEQLVANWLTLSPSAQKAALPILLRREAWTQSLLAGVKAGTVSGKDVLPQQWQALTTHPDPRITGLAKSLQKSTGQAVSADRKAIVDKLLPLAERAGNAERGRAVYERNCQVCHQMDDKGGKVGPDLTGIGGRPKADVLVEVVDPNRSVEGTFRQWSARTADDVITGRLLSESQTSIEIIDAAGTVHALQRNQIKSLTASDRSVMPEGFEAIPGEEMADLLEFMAASKAKH